MEEPAGEPVVPRQIRHISWSILAVALAAVLAASMLLAACGQRGPLYIPGKPGDPIYDRQNRGSVTPGSQPGSQPALPPASLPGSPPSNHNAPPSVPNDNRAKREDVS